MQGDAWHDVFFMLVASDEFPDGFVVTSPISGVVDAPSSSSSSSSSFSCAAAAGATAAAAAYSENSREQPCTVRAGLLHSGANAAEREPWLPHGLRAMVWPLTQSRPEEGEEEEGGNDGIAAAVGNGVRWMSPEAQIGDLLVSERFLAVTIIVGMEASVAVYELRLPGMSEDHCSWSEGTHTLPNSSMAAPTVIPACVLRPGTCAAELSLSHCHGDFHQQPSLLRVSLSSTAKPETVLDFCMACGEQLREQVSCMCQCVGA